MSQAQRTAHNEMVSVRPQVTVYVKPGYARCDTAVATMERVREQVPFELALIDVSTDPKLDQKFGRDVPVVMIDDRQAFKASVPEAAFKRRVKRAGRSSGGQPTNPENGPMVIDALEGLDAQAPRVPAPVMLAVVALTVIGALYWAWGGISEARFARGRLARELLQVQARNTVPPSFALVDAEGKSVRSIDRFRERVVFINFWATWCPPCVEEMPSMKRLQEKMVDEPRFAMLAISTDDDWSAVRKFFRGPPPFDVLLDDKGVAETYGTTKFPETYIIVDGRLVGYIVGPRDWDTWYAEAYLRALSEHGSAL